ncbi:DUF2790 domain-containing protein [Pseudomonas fulva]|nr:DUF2790 domain-containing protein [Pseudomonas fulva]
MSEAARVAGEAALEVTAYEYGMKLDFARIIESSNRTSSCEITPTRMTYEDSKGVWKPLSIWQTAIARPRRLSDRQLLGRYRTKRLRSA